MPRNTPFSVVVGRLLDAWIATSSDRPARPENIYSGVIDLLTLKMRLTLIEVRGADPLDWHLRTVRHSGFTSRLLDINRLFSDCRLGDFKDRAYMEQSVIPRLKEVVARQQPATELVKTKLLGVSLGYDRILLPQKNANGCEWVISSSYAQFLLGQPAARETLDTADEAIVQLLIEGSTAKEIAELLGLSHRTVEHRLEKLKQRYGARNTVHLVAMLVATHIDHAPAR
ncbi:helix-turn-helix transcriptional regulator [Rhizobium sp. AQ_MP]|uniref:helix-turn-helix transcriptional regulator n=1 Tax=Rhizobium sp. AQ_MP TaxID=2761536 RepID=UPI001639D960|nr:helix-turn-helix transcriptional regulator [Rhizobium sp. AQ_MP]MBC2772812.1 helix-turn-helix transcriptional regulator [Rhizobium sp. AQ_MP]